MHTVLWWRLKGTILILLARAGGSNVFSTTEYVLVLAGKTVEPEEETWRT